MGHLILWGEIPRTMGSHGVIVTRNGSRKHLKKGGKLESSIDDLPNIKTMTMLDGDVWTAMRDAHASDTARRAAVRAIFAAIEAMLWIQKQGLLATCAEKLSRPEVVMLTEEGYGSDDRGNIKVKKRNIRLRDNIRLTFRIASEAFPKFSPDFGNPMWDKLVRSIGVRNRLMHPKGVEDLAVSDDELIHAAEGYTWFTAMSTEILFHENLYLRAAIPPERLERLVKEGVIGATPFKKVPADAEDLRRRYGLPLLTDFNESDDTETETGE